MTPLSVITRQATRTKGDNLSIVTAPTHEAYETGLSATGFDFYALAHSSFKTWNSKFRKVPNSYHILNGLNVPYRVDCDVVLSQNKFGQYQILAPFASKFNLPLVSLEHTLPIPSWSIRIRQELQKMRGHLNVFISEYSVKEWGFSLEDSTVRVINHGIDTELFKPGTAERKNVILSVVNDWINRDWCCNFSGYMRTAGNLPCYILGDTPGLSSPAESTKALVEAYQTSSIFYNTSTISPVPTALMEAMACGCAVVSTATCMIPEIIQHGVNGFISNDEVELVEYLNTLLRDKELAVKMGIEARKTIVEKFNLTQFTDAWTKLLREASEINGCH